MQKIYIELKNILNNLLTFLHFLLLYNMKIKKLKKEIASSYFLLKNIESNFYFKDFFIDVKNINEASIFYTKKQCIYIKSVLKYYNKKSSEYKIIKV